MLLRRALLLVPLVLVAAWFAWRWGALPEPIPLSSGTHPDPRAVMSRHEFLWKALVMVGVVTAVFGLSAILSPRLMERGNAGIPDADYWLAPERRARTIARTVALMEVVGLAMAASLALDFVLVGEGAISGHPREMFGPHLSVLFATVGVLGSVWYYTPFVAHWVAERRQRR